MRHVDQEPSIPQDPHDLHLLPDKSGELKFEVEPGTQRASAPENYGKRGRPTNTLSIKLGSYSITSRKLLRDIVMTTAVRVSRVSAKGGFNLFCGSDASTFISVISVMITARLLSPSGYASVTNALTPSNITVFRDWSVASYSLSPYRRPADRPPFKRSPSLASTSTQRTSPHALRF